VFFVVVSLPSTVVPAKLLDIAALLSKFLF
jgi:hypothetical protein